MVKELINSFIRAIKEPKLEETVFKNEEISSEEMEDISELLEELDD